MIDNKTILCIIPARGGSKGIPNKNIKDLNGKPLISYTIEESLQSKYIDRVVVSTDSEDIAVVSKKYGAEVPFLRPDELARDDTPGITPIIHAVEWIKENENKEYDYVCLLQCTSPLRKSSQIDEAIEKIVSKDEATLVSVCESEESPYWMKEIKDDYLVDFIKTKEKYHTRQSLPKVYRLNGAIYIGKTNVVLKDKSFNTEKTLSYVMDNLSSVDIDNMMDFKLAEVFIKENGYELK